MSDDNNTGNGEEPRRERKPFVAKVTRTIRVPRDMHGTLIGKGGASIQELQRRYRIRIDLPAATHKNPLVCELKEDEVLLSGPDEDTVARGRKGVEAHLQQFRKVRAELAVTRQQHRAIVGKGGATVSAIQTHSNARIHLIPLNDEQSLCVVEGTVEQVGAAKTKLEQILMRESNRVTMYMTVPRQHQSAIIGPGGAVIRQLQDETGARINMPKRGAPDATRVSIEGNVLSVLEAKEAIERMVKQRKRLQGEMLIPAKQSVLIIGKQGKTVRELEERTGTHIHVENVDSETARVTVDGAQDGIKAVKAAIDTLLKPPCRGTMDIAAEHRGLVIGRGGAQLRDIMAETGAIITVPKAADELVTIEASSDVFVQRAKDMLAGVIVNNATTTETMVLPAHVVPLVSGKAKGGRSLGQLTSATGAKVSMGSVDDATATVSATLQGRRASVSAARAALRKLLVGATVQKDGKTLGAAYAPSEHHDSVAPLADTLAAEHKVTLVVAAASVPIDFVTLQGEGAKAIAAARAVVDAAVKPLLTVTEPFKVPFVKQSLLLDNKSARVREIETVCGASMRVLKGERGEDAEVFVEGTPDAVKAAKSALEEALARFDVLDEAVPVPSSMHGLIIGERGATISDIEKSTGAVLAVPKAGAGVEEVTVAGATKAIVAAARKAIADIVRDNTRVSAEIKVPSTLKMVIIGKKGATVRGIEQQSGARVNVRDEKDGVTTRVEVTGKRVAVDAAMVEMNKLVEEHKKPGDVVEMPKAMAGVLIGKKGSTIRELQKDTGVSITVGKGEQGAVLIEGATAEEVANARAVIMDFLRKNAKVSWEHPVPLAKKGLIIGSKGKMIKSLMERSGCNIYFIPVDESTNQVIVEGNEEGVAQVRATIETLLLEKVKMEMTVERRWYNTIIGKKGATIRKLEAESGCRIEIPKGNKTTITIEGRGDVAVGKARDAIEAIVKNRTMKKWETTLPIVRMGLIIGTKGETIRKLEADTGASVWVTPERGQCHVVCEGSNAEVDAAKAAVEALLDTMVKLELDIPKSVHTVIVGKKGANIKKVQKSTGALVQVPRMEDASSLVRIEGDTQEIVDAAKAAVMELAMRGRVTWSHEFPTRLQGIIIGKRGATIMGMEKESGARISVISDTAVAAAESWKAPKNAMSQLLVEGNMLAVEEAKKLLLGLIASRVTVEMDIPKPFHKLIEGRRGAGLKVLEKETGAAVRLPDAKEKGSTIVTVEGSEEQVKAAQEMLRKVMAGQLDLKAGEDVKYELRHMGSIIGGKGKTIKRLQKESGAKLQVDEEGAFCIVNVDGTPEQVAKAKELMDEAVYGKFAHRKTVMVPFQCQARVVGRGGSTIRELQKTHKVRIDIPRDGSSTSVSVAGDDESGVDEAIEEIKNLVGPEGGYGVTEEMLVASAMQGRLIGTKGVVVRRIQKESGARVNVGPAGDGRHARVEMAGSEKAVAAAKALVEEIIEIATRFRANLPIDPDLRGVLMGSVRAIQRESNAIITVPRENDEQVVVEGETEDAVRSAITLIDEALKRSVACKGELLLTTDEARKIIGRGGQMIRYIESESKAKVKVSDQGDDASRIVVLGDADGVAKAKELIEQVLEGSLRLRDDGAGRGRGGGEDGDEEGGERRRRRRRDDDDEGGYSGPSARPLTLGAFVGGRR